MDYVEEVIKWFNESSSEAQKEFLEKLGYDVMCVIVDTSLETALMRNNNRERSLPIKEVDIIWHLCQKNFEKFKKSFSYHLVVNNNDGQNDDLSPIAKFYNAPVANPIGKEIIANKESPINRKIPKSDLEKIYEFETDTVSSENPYAVFLVGKTMNGLLATTTRAADKGQQGQVGFPGGKVDPGETPEEACRRESTEEGWIIPNDAKFKIAHTSMFNNKLIMWLSTDAILTKMNGGHKEEKRGIIPIESTYDDMANSVYGNFGNEWMKTKNPFTVKS
jgi:8-oxo-dGTP pyrophosphatase MutT (NUDIX family)